MVNRDNWKMVEAYLKYKWEVAHRQDRTIDSLRVRLRFLLEWADETPFSQADRIRPTYPEYLNTVNRRGGGGKLVDKSIGYVLSVAVRFITWARETYPPMRTLKPAWAATLVPIRRDRPISNEREAVTLETVRALLATDWHDLRGRRVKAAAAFLFLSGMRATAFTTMPIAAVDLNARTVKQDPAIGVMTKRRKRATTFLLDIPDLLEVVTAWDNEVRQHAGPDALWFYRFTPVIDDRSPNGFSGLLQHEMRELFKRAGLKPMSPHKFRHGHASHAMKLAKDVGDFKALSQNLMHANLGITDGIYAILSQDDMQARMAALGNGAQTQATQPAAVVPDVAALIEETVKRLMRAQADQAAQLQPAEPKPRKPRKPRGAE